MKRHAGAVLAVVLFGLSVCAAGEDKVVDPARVFVTPLRWEREARASRNETLRYSYGSLSVLYLDGTYAQVSAPFTRASGKDPIELDLSEGFVLRLGTWSRVDPSVDCRQPVARISRQAQRHTIACGAVAQAFPVSF